MDAVIGLFKRGHHGEDDVFVIVFLDGGEIEVR